VNKHIVGADKWNSAMTFKFVGALRAISGNSPQVMSALKLGLVIGLLTEVIRKLVKGNKQYQDFASQTRAGRTADFVLDAFIIPSPYASSFGGFVRFPVLLWWAGGGLLSSVFETVQKYRKSKAKGPVEGELPADMSSTSLVGGGMIAGDALASLGYGIYRLLQAMLHG
jgi:hypothetical protein